VTNNIVVDNTHTRYDTTVGTHRSRHSWYRIQATAVGGVRLFLGGVTSSTLRRTRAWHWQTLCSLQLAEVISSQSTASLLPAQSFRFIAPTTVVVEYR